MVDIPVTELTMYKHGVGFFVREGALEGSQAAFTFKTSEVNDILKSITIYDRAGGRVKGIRYETSVETNEKLHHNLIRFNKGTPLTGLLSNIIGRRVIISTEELSVEGRVIGNEFLNPAAPRTQERISIGRVTILDDSGKVHIIPVLDVTSIEIIDGRARDDLDFYLEAQSTVASQNVVTVDLSEGHHDLIAYYVAPSPTWRVSYRFIGSSESDETRGGTAQLQAWALFDNRLDEDLENVRLTFIAGQPISFIYELYKSSIPKRPVVEDDTRVTNKPPEASADLLMLADAGPEPPKPAGRKRRGGSLLKRIALGAAESEAVTHTVTSTKDPLEVLVMADISNKLTELNPQGMDPEALRTLIEDLYRNALSANRIVMSRHESQRFRKKIVDGILAEIETHGLLDDGAITTQGKGEFFQYNVTDPVSVKRGGSAMVPIIDATMGYRNELLYNPNNELANPVAAMRFDNHTGLTFETGPVTVIEDGTYIGEAVLPFTRTGTEIFLPYAVELSIKVRTATRQSVSHSSLSFEDEFIVFEEYDTLATTYHFENVTGEDREILLQVPVNLSRSLFDTPEPERTSSDYHYWRVGTPYNQVTSFTVRERKLTSRSERIRSLQYATLKRYLQSGWLDQLVADQLQALLQQKDVIQNADSAIKILRAEQQEIFKRQEQLRQNIATLQSGDGRERDLYDRMLDQFLVTEDRFAETETEIVNLQADKADAEAAITDIIDALS